eukprot:jgi/Bigna1/136175/aug1.32_g10883
MDKHTNKKFIATGDLAQLDPIENEYLFNNVKNIDVRTTEAMNAMFPNIITLKICKRVKTDEERNTLAQLKEEIFNDEKTKPFDVLKKYFKVVKSISEVKTLNNITFYNFRSRSVGKHIHSLQKKPRKKNYVDGICYYAGMEIVCKKYNKKPKLYVNYTYEIIKVNKKEFVIQDVCDMGRNKNSYRIN